MFVFHMLVQGVFVSRAKVALVTLEGFLSRVFSHMLGEMILPHRGVLTLPTLVWFLHTAVFYQVVFAQITP